MTAIKVSYATDQGDPLDNMTEAEREVEHARQLDELRRTVEQQQGRKYSPDQPRDRGRFAEVPGGSGVSVDTPETPEQLHATFLNGFKNYKQLVHAHGGDLPFATPEHAYAGLNIVVAAPEDVTPEQRVVCEQAAAEFLNNPDYKPLFDAYGVPEIAVASRVVGDDDWVGIDPRPKGVQAQWASGTIILYGGVAGDPAYSAELEADAPRGFNVGGASLQATMLHEYGHQVNGVLGYDDSGGKSDFQDEFEAALLYDPDTTVEQSTRQISKYAGYSVNEMFAESFTTIYQPGFDINKYRGGARAVLQLIMDQIAEDTKKTNPDQGGDVLMTTVLKSEFAQHAAQGQTWDEARADRKKSGEKDVSGLIRWFNEGAGGAIAWGTPGDWAQCVAVASAHMGVEDAHGFCQLRHIEATGMSTAEHAHNEGKYSPDQPRDDHGRFGTIGDVAVLGDVAVREGGFSISLAGDHPHSGWMVSQSGTERSFPLESLASDQPQELTGIPTEPWHDNVRSEVNRFIADNRGDLNDDGVFLGGWVDNGRLYLDVSHNIPSTEDAMAYAQENDQLAAFNAGTGEYVRFDQPRAASRGPEPKQEKQKVFLNVTPDSDPDEIANRLIAALFV